MADDEPRRGGPGHALGTSARRVAALVRLVRLFAAAVLVVLATTAWDESWDVPWSGPGGAALVLVVWLVVTNLWSRRHDASGDEQAGVVVEVTSDLLLVLALLVVGGVTVLSSLPLAAGLVVVEVAARWPFRRAAIATGAFAFAWSLAIVTDWPAWAGWSSVDLEVVLVTPLASLPIALVLVVRIASDRERSRAVADAQAERLRATADDLREANDRLAIANEELSAFTGRIAHDLRSPLGTVVTALETLRRPDVELPKATRELLLDQAFRAATRSVDAISALLDHAAAEGRAADVALVDVREVATDVLTTLPLAMVGGVHVELPREPALVWADPTLLPLVVQNLLSNALTHGGSELSSVAIAVEETPAGVVVTVADDGVGIPDDLRGSVFDSGTRGVAGHGLGLGLATCRSIVVRHGGRIWVEDGLRAGAAIRFTLPWPAGGGPGRRRSVRELDALGDEPAPDQRLLATSSSSGSSSPTSVPSYRPGSAPTTAATSRPAPSAVRTSCGTV